VILDSAGVVAAQASAPLEVSRPHVLWSEQDPGDWWASTEAAVQALPTALRGAAQGIGLAGQMHGATLLGPDDKPLRPAILWNDGRSYSECAELENAVPELHQIAGNIAMPGFTPPKLDWVMIGRQEQSLHVRIGHNQFSRLNCVFGTQYDCWFLNEKPAQFDRDSAPRYPVRARYYQTNPSFMSSTDQ
jgi:glycerol kinase